MSEQTKQDYEFGPFRIDAANRQLLREGQVVPLTRKAFETLLVLVENRGRVLEKEELMQKLWPDSFVEEANLLVNISAVRKALGESGAEHNHIITIPGRGYRFTGEVQERGSGIVEFPGPEQPNPTPSMKGMSVLVRMEQKLGPPAVPPDVKTSAARHQLRWARWPLIGLAAMLAAAIGGAVWFYSFRPAAESSMPPMRTIPFTSLPGLENNPALSPDGHQIAFSWIADMDGTSDLYVKMVGAGNPLRLTTTHSEDVFPTWSPDGRYIAFIRLSENESGIFLVPSLGGTERKLHSYYRGVFWFLRGLNWSPDGKFLAFPFADSPQDSPGIFLLSMESLERHRLTSPPAQSLGDGRPAFSPDGQTLAFIRGGSEWAADIYILSARGGEPRRLTLDNRAIWGLAWTSDGREIVFASNRGGGHSLWRVPAVGGAPKPLAVGGDNVAYPSISRQGDRLAYTRWTRDPNIWRIKVPSSTDRDTAPTKLISTTRQDLSPQISPDGKRIVFTSDRSGSTEIWVCDSDGTNPLQLTSFDGPLTDTPRWSPDGSHIVFDSRPVGNQSGIYVIKAEGGSPRRITTEAFAEVVPSWSRDGRWIYFSSNRTSGQDWQVWKVPSGGGRAVQVTKKGGFAAFESPDGKFLYYAKRELAGLWRMPIEGGEESLVLDLIKPGYWGQWAVVDKGIYFINQKTKFSHAIEFFSFVTGQVMPVSTLEKPPCLWFQGLAVSPDGRWILYAQMDEESSDIMLIENIR